MRERAKIQNRLKEFGLTRRIMIEERRNSVFVGEREIGREGDRHNSADAPCTCASLKKRNKGFNGCSGSCVALK